MPVPSTEQGRNNGVSGPKSNKIDFAPSLDSIDSKHPQSHTTHNDGSTWDTETDHILSYFLGGDVGGTPQDESGFSSTAHTVETGAGNNDESAEPIHIPTTPAVHFYPHSSSSSSSRHDKNRNRHHHNQNYYRSQHSHTYATIGHNSSTVEVYNESKPSELRSVHSSAGTVPVSDERPESHSQNADSTPLQVAVSISQASLMVGGHAIHQHRSDQAKYQQHLFYDAIPSNVQALQSAAFNPFGSENPSPISPAGMIGLINENLLLPVPSPPIVSNRDRSVLLTTATKRKEGDNDTAMSSLSITQQATCNDEEQLELTRKAPQEVFASRSFQFTTYHAESRILPPEKLLEVFPGNIRSSLPASPPTSAPNLQQIGQSPVSKEMTSRNTINGNNAAAGNDSNLQHVQNLPDPSYQQPQHPVNSILILANQPTDQFQQQQFLYANKAELAAAILSRHRGLMNSTSAPLVESEEKRAKRLERNRESARKSRRKKKERLITLGAQVAKLQDEIEVERRRHINAIVPLMNRHRLEDIDHLLHQLTAGQIAQADVSDRTCVVIQQSGPNSRIMRSVLDFQYTSLKQLTLPSYQKMLLWITLLEESYFTIGKEEYVKRATNISSKGSEGGKNDLKSSTTAAAIKNISSKQVGDEIFNGLKDDKGSNGKKKRDSENEIGDRPAVTSSAFNGARTWPLLSFELRLSVDQEERFLAIHKQIRNESVAKYQLPAANGNSNNIRCDTLGHHRSQITTAITTAESLSKAVGSLGHVISRREDNTFARILQPQQLLAYQTWLSHQSNRERCRKKILTCKNIAFLQPTHDSYLGTHSASTTPMTDNYMDSSNNGTQSFSKEVSLQGICRRLNEVLHISQQ